VCSPFKNKRGATGGETQCFAGKTPGGNIGTPIIKRAPEQKKGWGGKISGGGKPL